MHDPVVKYELASSWVEEELQHLGYTFEGIRSFAMIVVISSVISLNGNRGTFEVTSFQYAIESACGNP